jgi:RNA polymerase sigma-54 factor
MQLTPSLNIKQRQSLVMTPQLQQAIKLLQMTNLDLSKYLEEQTFENPFLETDENKPNQQNSDMVENPPNRDEQINKKDVDVSIENGQALSDDPTSNEDFDNRFDCNLVEYDGPNQNSGQFQGSSTDKENILEVTIEDHPNSLYQHVERQILCAFEKSEEKFIAIKFLEHLEPTGWLGKSIEEIALECGISVEQAQSILLKLQSFEPAGLFASNLKECLLIQAKASENYSNSLEILLQNLPLLAKGDLKSLAKKCDCKIIDINNYLKLIRSFNPKPGSMFENDLPQINSPDLIVKKNKKWLVS